MGIQGSAKDWRKEKLEDLRQFQSTGNVRKVIWLTARDEHVCPLCAAREGKYFTFKQAREELKGKFCRPSDPDDKCRCCFIVDDTCFK